MQERRAKTKRLTARLDADPGPSVLVLPPPPLLRDGPGDLHARPAVVPDEGLEGRADPPERLGEDLAAGTVGAAESDASPLFGVGEDLDELVARVPLGGGEPVDVVGTGQADGSVRPPGRRRRGRGAAALGRTAPGPLPPGDLLPGRLGSRPSSPAARTPPPPGPPPAGPACPAARRGTGREQRRRHALNIFDYACQCTRWS